MYLGEPKGIFCVLAGASYAFTVQGANGAVVLCIVPLVSTVSAEAGSCSCSCSWQLQLAAAPGAILVCRVSAAVHVCEDLRAVVICIRNVVKRP